MVPGEHVHLVVILIKNLQVAINTCHALRPTKRERLRVVDHGHFVEGSITYNPILTPHEEYVPAQITEDEEPVRSIVHPRRVVLVECIVHAFIKCCQGESFYTLAICFQAGSQIIIQRFYHGLCRAPQVCLVVVLVALPHVSEGHVVKPLHEGLAVLPAARVTGRATTLARAAGITTILHGE